MSVPLNQGAAAHLSRKSTVLRSLAAELSCACITIGTLTASATENPPDTSAVPSSSTQELAKEKHNPFADQITLPLQLSSDLDVGPGNGTVGGLNIQPTIPFSLGQDWKLITRPSLSLLLSEQPNRKLGLGDLELQTYLTPASAETWIWGAGPDLQAPTATEHEFGTGKWSAGPALGLVYMNGPWVNGILANHVWSFAGEHDRDAVSVSTFEPVISYNFESGWYNRGLAGLSKRAVDYPGRSRCRQDIPNRETFPEFAVRDLLQCRACRGCRQVARSVPGNSGFTEARRIASNLSLTNEGHATQPRLGTAA